MEMIIDLLLSQRSFLIKYGNVKKAWFSGMPHASYFSICFVHVTNSRKVFSTAPVSASA